MSQCHGITNARRIVGEKTRDTQRVTICDGDGEVVLEISSTWPSGLTSDQARFVARLLCEAADRVDEATAEALRAMDEEEAANVAARDDKDAEVQAT